MTAGARALWVILTLSAAFGGCEREARRFNEPAATAAPPQPAPSAELHAGGASQPLPTQNRYEENAFAISQGKRLFSWFNCVGCHANGGGGSGPALMDDKWIYGHEPANIFETIVRGRPNGMPAFGGKIPEAQVWQLVAYVRSIGGFVGSAAAPGRNDDMQTSGPESTRDPQTPKNTVSPPN